jgi:hypothetical protein
MRSSGESEATDFNPIRYLDPLTPDRGAALARMMQSDKEALDALVSEPARPKRIRDRAGRRLRQHPRDERLIESPQRELGDC